MGLLYSPNQLYTYMCGNIFNPIKTSGHFFRKIYLSLYWKGCVWEGIGEWTKTATYWPPNSSGYHRIAFSFSWASQPGAWGLSLCWDMVLIPASSSPTDLNFLSPGLYNNLTSTYFLRASQFALNLTPRQSRSPLISWYLRPDAPVIYTGAFLFLIAWPGRRWICSRAIQHSPDLQDRRLTNRYYLISYIAHHIMWRKIIIIMLPAIFLTSVSPWSFTGA